MPKKEQSKAEALAQQLADQVLAGNPTPEQLRELMGELLGPPVDATFDDPSAAAPVELPEPPDTPLSFTVRMDLVGARPPIWRKLELPGELTLDQVHDVIQMAMGWQDCHLHSFELPAGGRRPGPRFVNDGDEDPGVGTHERAVRLDQVLRKVGDTLLYEYDFGDGWQHALKVIDVGPRGDGTVRCIDGRRACPPEDCGGIYGYEEILDALATPPAQREEWAQEQLDWLPTGLDPKVFDAVEVNQMLAGWRAGYAIPGPPPPPKALLPLLTMGPGVPADLQRLIDAADLGADTPEPSPEVAARLVEPWMVLLREVGDGLGLTKAGYLPPATVRRIVDALHLDSIWIGKGNREEHTLPVAELHSTATALGLLRKHKGQLLPTKLARRFAGDPSGALVDTTDPVGLLRHLIDRLPLSSSAFGAQAATLLLLGVATGAHPRAILDPAAEALGQLGWRSDRGEPVTSAAVREHADLTYAALQQLHAAAGGEDRMHAKTTPDVVRDLARRALRDDPDQAPAASSAGGTASLPAKVTPLRPGAAAAHTEPEGVELDPNQLAKESAEALMQGVAEARQPLEAELVLCAALGAVQLGVDEDVEAALEYMLGKIVQHAGTVGSDEALGLLRVASVLGPEATRAAARDAAQRLAADGVPDRPWASRIGTPALVRAWRYGDLFGSQGSVGLTFDYRGREHTVTVLIDHELGGGVKDIWVAEGKQSKRLHDDVRRKLLGKAETFFEDIDAAGAADVLEVALAQPLCPEQEDQIQDTAMHLHLLRSRTRRLRELAGGGR